MNQVNIMYAGIESMQRTRKVILSQEPSLTRNQIASDMDDLIEEYIMVTDKMKTMATFEELTEVSNKMHELNDRSDAIAQRVKNWAELRTLN